MSTKSLLITQPIKKPYNYYFLSLKIYAGFFFSSERTNWVANPASSVSLYRSYFRPEKNKNLDFLDRKLFLGFKRTSNSKKYIEYIYVEYIC